jgi:hypothetical protein
MKPEQAKMRHSRSPSTASKALGTQNKGRTLRIFGPELVRAIEAKVRQGAPYGNENAKKTLTWLDSYDLSTPAGVDGFLQEVIRRTWTGELGTRAAGALNGSLRILLEHLTLPALEKRITDLESRELKK